MDDDNNSFVHDAADISESVCEHYAFQNVGVNIDNVLKNSHKKAISDLDNASEFTNFWNPDLAEELLETVTFCGQEKRVSYFVIHHGVGSIGSFFYEICYAVLYEKTEKVDQYNNFQDEIGTELYEKLLGLKESYRLKLDHHRFEKQCFDINKALIEHGYFLKVSEAKNKLITDEKRQRKIGNEKKFSSCIMEKFRCFDIVSIEYGRRQRTKFSSIDIIYKPVKKWNNIIDC